MLVLALDTAFDACSAALAECDDNGCRLLSHCFERMATGQAERLVPMIGEVLRDAARPVSAMTRIAVSAGPGTFTGTRIAVAAARALALATKAPVTGLSSLHLMARQAALAMLPSGDLSIVVDVRRGEVYLQRFDAEGCLPRGEPALLPVAEARVAAAGSVCVGSGSALVSGLHEPTMPDLVPDARFAFDLLPVRPAAGRVSPLYLRPPDAKPSSAAPLLRL